MTYQCTWRQDAIAFWPYSFTDVEESTHRPEAHRRLQLLCDRNHLNHVSAISNSHCCSARLHLDWKRRGISWSHYMAWHHRQHHVRHACWHYPLKVCWNRLV